MSRYVQLGPVNTWYDEQGTGEPLVLLHPGGADSRAWQTNIDELATKFRCYLPDRRGHGRTGDVDGPISYDLMADDTIAFLERLVTGPAHVIGCSDGATVALLTALKRPDLVRRLALVSGVFHHDGWLPGAIDLDADSTEFLSSWYAEVSPDGGDHYPVVAAKLDRMHRTEPTLTEGDLGRLSVRTLVMVGDDDEVRLEHAVAMYRALPDGELAVVPRTSHGLLVEKPALCNAMLLEFLLGGDDPTMAPIRRRPK